jgi:hypothetical protein
MSLDGVIELLCMFRRLSILLLYLSRLFHLEFVPFSIWQMLLHVLFLLLFSFVFAPIERVSLASSKFFHLIPLITFCPWLSVPFFQVQALSSYMILQNFYRLSLALVTQRIFPVMSNFRLTLIRLKMTLFFILQI